MYNIFIVFILLVTTLLGTEKKQVALNNDPHSISLLFIGDIMGHGPQINSSYNPLIDTHTYRSVFKNISPLIKSSDFAIANLEVTFAGKPYSGYPRFSSPDELAQAIKESGITAVVTANNHCIDRGYKGAIRTLNVLDTYGLQHTGTFRNNAEKEKYNLLIFEKNGIKVGLLNYTFSTNGIATPKPLVINRISKQNILNDINQSKNKKLDKLIVFLHWGKEYTQIPNNQQKELAKFLFNNGVDIVIGSHPHVVQPIIYTPSSFKNKETLVVYSLGNFISNQRTTPRDGGIMYKIEFTKNNSNTTISYHGYYLTWVHKYYIEKTPFYEVIPCYPYDKNSYPLFTSSEIKKMKIFENSVRKLLLTYNQNSYELPVSRLEIPTLKPTTIEDIDQQIFNYISKRLQLAEQLDNNRKEVYISRAKVDQLAHEYNIPQRIVEALYYRINVTAGFIPPPKKKLPEREKAIVGEE